MGENSGVAECRYDALTGVIAVGAFRETPLQNSCIRSATLESLCGCTCCPLRYRIAVGGSRLLHLGSGFDGVSRSKFYVGDRHWLGSQRKISVFIYAVAILLAFVNSGLACASYARVALMWLIPDRRIENTLTLEAGREYFNCLVGFF